MKIIDIPGTNGEGFGIAGERYSNPKLIAISFPGDCDADLLPTARAEIVTEIASSPPPFSRENTFKYPGPPFVTYDPTARELLSGEISTDVPK